MSRKLDFWIGGKRPTMCLWMWPHSGPGRNLQSPVKARCGRSHPPSSPYRQNLRYFTHYRWTIECLLRSGESAAWTAPRMKFSLFSAQQSDGLAKCLSAQHSPIEVPCVWIKATPLWKWLARCCRGLFSSIVALWACLKGWTGVWSQPLDLLTQIGSIFQSGGKQRERRTRNQGGNLSSCAWLMNNESFWKKAIIFTRKKKSSLKWQKLRNYRLVLSSNTSPTSLLLSACVPGGSAPASGASLRPRTRVLGGVLLLTALSLHECIVFWMKDYECFQLIIKGHCSLAPLNFFKTTTGADLRISLSWCIGSLKALRNLNWVWGVKEACLNRVLSQI